eukprot:TRINITY_DN1629_c0_g2_i1.p1 TRINITY_DN1629_c0_g2~~TRINITY_DN1629_c0_g2_i1.p1  ORF type:complete len:160 (+),score=31.96 TRINITY_DN1629_c0_g2_i1:210-689(+)
MTSDEDYNKLDQIICNLISDPQREVQEMAAGSLSSVIKTRPPSHPSITSLIDKFRQMANVPQATLSSNPQLGAQVDSGILGLFGLINAFPYSIPIWMPDLLVFLSSFSSQKMPIKGSVNKGFSMFWQTHSDEWAVHKEKFTELQRDIIKNIFFSPSYFS